MTAMTLAAASTQSRSLLGRLSRSAVDFSNNATDAGTEPPTALLRNGGPDTRSLVMLNSSSTSREGAAEGFVRETAQVEVARILERAASDTFEPGMASRTYYDIAGQLQRYGPWFVEALGAALFRELVSEDVTTEILRSLGRIDDRVALSERMKLLIEALKDARPVIRDEAALALLDLGDPRARRFIVEAAERETVETLRADLLNVAAQIG